MVKLVIAVALAVGVTVPSASDRFQVQVTSRGHVPCIDCWR